MLLFLFFSVIQRSWENFCINIFFTLDFLFIRNTQKALALIWFMVSSVLSYSCFSNHNRLQCPLKPQQKPHLCTWIISITFITLINCFPNLKGQNVDIGNQKMYFSDLSDSRSTLTVVILLSFVKSLSPVFLSQSSVFAHFEGYPFCLKF